ncbi:hypothetical protein Y032_0020g57 [Ancylostoma ceylanicum]|uniref:Uncharacterized protein n=1 Tax=Ancylostoma ceylanicum TaxID=53326 RepID=A0A016V2G9_9BILA|nr:hypothetical protein Y032_0020g57 [Ancylostoma ceylanicum]
MLNFETTPQDLCFHYINYSKKNESSNYSIDSMSTFRYRVKRLLWRIGPVTALTQDRRNIKSLFLSIIDNLLDDAIDRRRMLEEHNVVEDVDCHHEVVRTFDLICIDVNKVNLNHFSK